MSEPVTLVCAAVVMASRVEKSKTPNQALQQTGHANEGSARHYANLRVSRLLSFVFGEEGICGPHAASR